MVIALIKAMRPKQWIKNLLLFAGIIFSGNLTNLPMLIDATLGFISFCLLSGAVYVINDIRDLESDRQHPRKRFRPIASGALSVPLATIWAVVLVGAGLGLAFSINFLFGCVAFAYLLLLNFYSYFLKHIVIVDIIVVAIGFVLRAFAGIEAIRFHGIAVPITPWFLSVTFFLALFIVICKRRHELILLNEKASDHRPVLEEYSAAFVDQMIAVVTAATVISYALWTTIGYTRNPNMIYTLPFALYGIFRYLYIAYHKEEGGAPELVLLTDKPLLVDVFLWGITVIILLYFV